MLETILNLIDSNDFWIVILILVLIWLIIYQNYLLALRVKKDAPLEISKLRSNTSQEKVSVMEPLIKDPNNPLAFINNEIKALEQFKFETEFIDLISNLAKELNKNLKGDELKTISLNLTILGDYMDQVHIAMRHKGKPQDVELVEFVRNIIDSFRKYLRQNNIHLISSFPNNAIIKIEERDISLVLVSVIESIMGKTKNGESIKVHISKPKDKVILEFSLPNLFLSNNQLDNLYKFGNIDLAKKESKSMKNGSIGSESLYHLQLAASKEIMEKNGGDLEVKSGSEIGTTFKLWWPINN